MVWSAFNARGINLSPPEHSASIANYLKCDFLSTFDDYNSGVEKNAGFPVGTLIWYSRKGEESTAVINLLLVNDFEDKTPQIWLIAENATEQELKDYMKLGTERFAGILKTHSYDENRIYANPDGTCNQSDEKFIQHFFEEKDAK